MHSDKGEVLSSPYLKVYHAASAYIDMDYRKPLKLRDAIREAVYADLIEKQTQGVSVTFITKNHRAYTDGITKRVQTEYPGTGKVSLSRLSYWSMTITACLGSYILARLLLLDIGEETPYAMAVTPRRLITFIGLMLTLQLVSQILRSRHSKGMKHARYLSGFLLLVFITLMFPALPFLGGFLSDVSLFRLNLSIVFVCSLTVALASLPLRNNRFPGFKKDTPEKA